MLTISDAQQDAMFQDDHEKFVGFIIEHLREEHYDYVTEIPDRLLKPMVEAGLKRAKGHGFSTSAHLTTYVVWMFTMAPNFDEQPQIAQILKNDVILPQEKLNYLMADEMEQAWEEAQDNFDEDAWFDDED